MIQSLNPPQAEAPIVGGIANALRGWEQKQE